MNAVPLKNIGTGIGRYIHELYTHIQKLYPEIEIRYFDGVRLCKRMPLPPEGLGPWTTAVDFAWRLPSALVYMARMLAHELYARRFYRLSKGFDVYHEAGYCPFKTAASVKTIFTIHDVSLKTLPAFHPKDRVWFFEKYFKTSLNHTDQIITPSEFTKKEIQKAYSELPAEKIHPIPLGCNKSRFYLRNRAQITEYQSRRQLPADYILFTGTTEPRKNVMTLLKAMARLPTDMQLVCTGWSGWGQDLEKELQALGLKNRVIFTGYASDGELPLLYAGARVFVYPSFYEGFGLPVLEAMACGCPVVCSNSASLPEVTGSAAILCSPNDAAGLARAIQEVFASDDLHARMRRKGLGQAAMFDWCIAAEKTVSIFGL